MKALVGIVDYGLGNLHSVIKAFVYVGANVEVATAGTRFGEFTHLVIPGVGAFSDGMAGLQSREQVEPVIQFAASGRPVMGICLGAQLLLEESEEFGFHKGIGIIPGRVTLIPNKAVKVPHVGWQRLIVHDSRSWEKTALGSTPQGTWAYFIHSYHACPADPSHVLAVCKHGENLLTAAAQKDNVIGVQFHPEKSGKAGLHMLKTFISL